MSFLDVFVVIYEEKIKNDWDQRFVRSLYDMT